MHTLYFDLRDTKGQQKTIEDNISAAARLLRDGALVAIIADYPGLLPVS